MNAWRRELRRMLAETKANRPPALRRSRRNDFLYATDLPAAGGENGIRSFCAEAETGGWQWEREGSWIQLRKDSELPPENWFDGPFGQEAACCASLLERHKAGGETLLERMALIKAGEEGPEAYEKVCARLHGQWAERLRRGEPLPGLSLHYFGEEK